MAKGDTSTSAVDMQRMLDQLPVQVWRMSAADTYAWANQAFAAYHGRQPGEQEGLRVSELLPPELAPEVCRTNEKVLGSGETLVLETWVKGAQGVRRLFAITKTPDRLPSGEIVGVVCVAADVTEQRAAEAALAQKEENFRSLVETIEDLVVITDEDGHIIYGNPALREKLEYADHDLSHLTVMDMHPSWVRDEAMAIFGEMVAGERHFCPLPLVTRTGTLLPVETRVWYGTWNGQRSVFGVSRDLRREQESLQKFEALFRRNPALMAINDVESMQFTDVNDAWLRTLGFTTEEVLGQNSLSLDLFPMQEDKQRLTQLLAAYGRLEEVELVVKAKDGRLIHGLFSGEIIESHGRRFFLTVMVDISARRKAESERELVIRELKSALDQIKTLRGILPICAKCKKIRDDKGYWQQVEAYVTRHTDAHFSHGMCPGCLEEMYNEFMPLKEEGPTPA